MFLQGKPTQPTKHARIMVINQPGLSSGVFVDEVFGLKHFQREAGPFDETKNLNILPYLDGSVFQQDLHWDVFSFHKLVADPKFMNAAA